MLAAMFAVLVVLAVVALLAVPKLLRDRPSLAQRRHPRRPKGEPEGDG